MRKRHTGNAGSAEGDGAGMSISDFIMGIEDYEDVQRWKKMAKYFRSGDAAALSILFMNEICPDQEEGRNCDLCGREAKDLCDLISRVQAAAEMAEGKIGPDAETGNRDHVVGPDQMVPCWQITEDRVTAIDQGLRFLEWSNAKNGSVETKKHIATLQTMLEEASGQRPTTKVVGMI